MASTAVAHPHQHNPNIAKLQSVIETENAGTGANKPTTDILSIRSVPSPVQPSATNIDNKRVESPEPRPTQSSDVVDDGGRGDTLNLHLLKTSYEARLKTYRTSRWVVEVAGVTPESLAAAGFYYTGYSDVVCCALCNVEVGKWEAGDDPLADHIKWSPTCTFHQELHTDNATRDGQDTCGIFGIVHSQTSIAENSLAVASTSTASTSQQHVAGIQQVKLPTYRHYAHIDKRLETFTEWPVSIAQKPRNLAEAGFFYTGKSDQTVCFQCGGGLKDWECNDQPWQQHAKWFPKCTHVLLQKGTEYVAEQQREKEKEDVAKAEEEAAKAEELAKVVAPPVADPAESIPSSVLCKICLNKEMGVVFLPCGHMVACVDCAPVLTTCAICRKQIDAHIRVFLS